VGSIFCCPRAAVFLDLELRDLELRDAVRDVDAVCFAEAEGEVDFAVDEREFGAGEVFVGFFVVVVFLLVDFLVVEAGAADCADA
jgi:hypothetical protein